MSDDATVLQVTGGSAGLEASYDAMLGLAADHDDVGDHLRTLARQASRALTDGDVLESALLSPATAVRAEAAVLAATSGRDGTLVGSAACELDAAAIRASVSILEQVDAAQHAAFEAIDYGVGFGLGSAIGLGSPGVVAGLSAGLQLGGEDLVTEHPDAVQHLVNGGGGLVDGLVPGATTFHPTTGDAAAQLADLYPDGSPVVTQVPSTVGGDAPGSVQDLLSHLEQVAALSPEADSPGNGTIEVQTLTGADGQAVHIVNLPGTDDLTTTPWTADGDVRDMGTNLELVAGLPDDYQQGILQAMSDAGIGADEPVLIVGHSQGGMEAAAILAGHSGFHVTDVVTAGSPTAQVPAFPAGSNVLSLEQHGDLVPLLDGEPNPPSVQQTTVLVDVEPGSGVTAHHDYDVYVDAAAAADSSTHPSVVSSVASLHDHGFLGGDVSVASQVFQVVREPED
jgi:hypothetical protein